MLIFSYLAVGLLPLQPQRRLAFDLRKNYGYDLCQKCNAQLVFHRAHRYVQYTRTIGS